MDIRLSKLHDRQAVLEYLDKNKFRRVIDIGTYGNSWAKDFLTHWVDINSFSDGGVTTGFVGNINYSEVWGEVEKDVEKHGKFDFAICTHTLEDISNPIFVAQKLSKIAKRGFSAVPSKYQEVARGIESSWRGYMHHRWIFNSEEGRIVAYPKLNFVEFMGEMDSLATQLSPDNAELQWWWEESMDLVAVNNDFLGPSSRDVVGYYGRMLL